MVEVLKSLFFLFMSVFNAIIELMKVVFDINNIKKIMIAELFGLPVYVISIVSLLIVIIPLLISHLKKYK